MSFDAKKGFCFCERCGHDWIAKPVDNVFVEPRSCAKCKSKVWNQPRVYSVKYISAVLSKRFKPTGRAAARPKVEPEVENWKRIAEDPEKDRWDKIYAILDTLEPEEREAAWKLVMLHEYGSVLDELGLR